MEELHFYKGGAWVTEGEKFIAFIYSPRGVRKLVLRVSAKSYDERDWFRAVETTADIATECELRTFQAVGPDGARRLVAWP